MPFLILFHRAEDEGSVKIFEKEVKNQLAHVKSNKKLSMRYFFKSLIEIFNKIVIF